MFQLCPEGNSRQNNRLLLVYGTHRTQGDPKGFNTSEDLHVSLYGSTICLFSEDYEITFKKYTFKTIQKGISCT